MKFIFDSYSPDEKIPVLQYLKNKKIKKYFSLETMAAIVGLGKLIESLNLDIEIPLYYATGMMEYEDYGLKEIGEHSVDRYGNFSQKSFIESSRIQISPLNQFKVLQNMPLSFLSINYNLRGDNAVLCSSAAGLIIQALNSDTNGHMIIGAGKVYKDRKVEAGFAYLEKREIENSHLISYAKEFTKEAIEIFRTLSQGNDL